MKKLFMALLLMAGMFTLASCDDDPAEGEAKTTYQFFLTANNQAKNLLEMKFSSSGSGATMITLLSTVKDNDDLYSSNGRHFTGKIPSWMVAIVQCKLKENAQLTEEKYVIDLRLTSKVVTYDEKGNMMSKKNFISTWSLKDKQFTKAELQAYFGESKSITIDGQSKEDGSIEPYDTKDTQEYK